MCGHCCECVSRLATRRGVIEHVGGHICNRFVSKCATVLISHSHALPMSSMLKSTNHSAHHANTSTLAIALTRGAVVDGLARVPEQREKRRAVDLHTHTRTTTSAYDTTHTAHDRHITRTGVFRYSSCPKSATISNSDARDCAPSINTCTHARSCQARHAVRVRTVLPPRPAAVALPVPCAASD
jgi:hypothetical protein